MIFSLAQNNGTSGGLISFAIVFIIIAMFSYVLGSRGVGGMDEGIGKTLLFVFLVLSIIFIIVGFVNSTPEQKTADYYRGYKQGQVDYSEGKIHWYKKEEVHTDIVWEYK